MPSRRGTPFAPSSSASSTRQPTTRWVSRRNVHPADRHQQRRGGHRRSLRPGRTDRGQQPSRSAGCGSGPGGFRRRTAADPRGRHSGDQPRCAADCAAAAARHLGSPKPTATGSSSPGCTTPSSGGHAAPATRPTSTPAACCDRHRQADGQRTARPQLTTHPADVKAPPALRTEGPASRPAASASPSSTDRAADTKPAPRLAAACRCTQNDPIGTHLHNRAAKRRTVHNGGS